MGFAGIAVGAAMVSIPALEFCYIAVVNGQILNHF